MKKFLNSELNHELKNPRLNSKNRRNLNWTKVGLKLGSLGLSMTETGLELDLSRI